MLFLWRSTPPLQVLPVERRVVFFQLFQMMVLLFLAVPLPAASPTPGFTSTTVHFPLVFLAQPRPSSLAWT